ncbi:hypothetical protein MKX01_016330 [Papaver californicum]|nr:hypothetical protein MKX01_016330 [Papaver californicum]
MKTDFHFHPVRFSEKKSNFIYFLYLKDFMNDRMQEGFLQRILYAMKPDEALDLFSRGIMWW